MAIDAERHDATNDLSRIVVPQHSLMERWRVPLAALIVVLLLAWSWGPVEMSKSTSLVTDWRNMVDLLSGFMKPNFRDWKVFVAAMIETVQIAIWGTALAVLIGAPFSILSVVECLPGVDSSTRAPADGRRRAPSTKSSSRSFSWWPSVWSARRRACARGA